MNQVKSITEKTLVPISLLIVIIGAVMWLTSLWELSKSSAAAIKEIKEEKTAHNIAVELKFNMILTELNYLKGKLDGRFEQKAKE